MSWFSKPLNVLVTAFAAIMVVLSIVGIIYGVSTHEEAGLLRICWNEKNAAEYIVPFEGAAVGDCTEPEDLIWSKKQIPLTVVVTDVRSGGDGSEAGAAMMDINQQLGFTLFTPAQKEGSVNFYLGMPVEGGKRLGTARHYKGPDGMYAQGYVYGTTGSSRLTFLVAHHELLHIAGLAHDDFPDSAMYGMDHDDSLQKMTPARITDYDRSLLRELYSPAVR